jgi:hypothetical protein
VHAAWLENSLASFQSNLFDALLTATRNSHAPLSRSNVQQTMPAGNSLTKQADSNSAQIKSVLMNQVRRSKSYDHCFRRFLTISDKKCLLLHRPCYDLFWHE